MQRYEKINNEKMNNDFFCFEMMNEVPHRHRQGLRWPIGMASAPFEINQRLLSSHPNLIAEIQRLLLSIQLAGERCLPTPEDVAKRRQALLEHPEGIDFSVMF